MEFDVAYYIALVVPNDLYTKSFWPEGAASCSAGWAFSSHSMLYAEIYGLNRSYIAIEAKCLVEWQLNLAA